MLFILFNHTPNVTSVALFILFYWYVGYIFSSWCDFLRFRFRFVFIIYIGRNNWHKSVHSESSDSQRLCELTVPCCFFFTRFVRLRRIYKRPCFFCACICPINDLIFLLLFPSVYTTQLLYLYEIRAPVERTPKEKRKNEISLFHFII